MLIGSAMIFIQDNILLERELTFDDIKPRLLGHWGTCPGLILVYAHLNRIIKKTNLDSLLVVGPGELNFLTFEAPFSWLLIYSLMHHVISYALKSCLTLSP